MSRSTPQFKRSHSYILKGGTPVPADSQTVEAFLEDIDNCRVADALLYAPDGTEIRISTDFIGIDQGGWLDDGPPILWETMIFWPGNDKLDGWQQHYTSEKAARAGHQVAVAIVKAALGSEAEEYATQKMWEFRHKKDERGASIWLSVIQAIKELRNTAPPGNLH